MVSVAGVTVKGRVFVALTDAESVTLTKTVLVPGVVGLPVIAPVVRLIERPLGSVVADHWLPPDPPEAVTVVE